jgi:hypothetical protein
LAFTGGAFIVGDGSGVFVGVGGGVAVLVGKGVSVGKGKDVGVGVGGTGVEAGEQPLKKTVNKTNTRSTDLNDFFITLFPFGLIAQQSAQRYALLECPCLGRGKCVSLR